MKINGFEQIPVYSEVNDIEGILNFRAGDIACFYVEKNWAFLRIKHASKENSFRVKYSDLEVILRGDSNE